MNANLDKIALDLYGKIQTRFPNIKIGDENAAVLSKKEDIPNARFFEFEYEEDGEPLGTVAITLDSDDGVVVQVSGDLVNDNDNTTHHGAYKFLRSFRQFAKDRLLNFDIQNIGKSNMDKRDYEFQAKRKEEPVMPQAQAPIMENRMYGSNKISYQDLGEARLVVRHTQAVNPLVAAGRTMHIESIYIENSAGERFKYPFKHFNGARALAEHIKAGGNPYDGIGKHITGLSEELAQLRKFKNYVGRQDQLSEAMGDITDVVMERIDAVKKEIHSLQRPAYYQQFAESFQEQEEQMIPEAIVDNWIDRLTIRTFNEELKSVFPYIFKLVDESSIPVKELSPEDLYNEASDTVEKDEKGNVKSWKHEGDWKKSTGKDPRGRVTNLSDKARRDTEKKAKQPEDQFEEFLEDLVREDKDEIFSPNKDAQNAAIGKLNQILDNELKGGPEGVNAVQSLKGLIDDPEFLMSLQDIDPNLDIRPLVQQYILDTDPSIATQLHFGSDANAGEQETPAPEAPPATPAPEAPPATPAPEAPPATPPLAEGGNLAKLKAKFIQAKECGANLGTKMDFGNREMTLHDAIKECGMSPEDVGFNTQKDEDGVHQILKSIAGFWNRENRNFTIGGTRAKTKIVKDFKDGEFPNASPEDVKKVLAMIEKMDPSGNEHNQIMHLAGVGQEREVAEAQPMDNQDLAKFSNIVKQLSAMQNGGDAPPMKLKMGDQEIDLGNAEQISSAMKGIMGGMMQGIQGQVPNQSVQVPGGQLNPADMMKDIMGKINFGK